MERFNIPRVRLSSGVAGIIVALSVVFGSAFSAGRLGAASAEQVPPEVAKYPERPISYVVPWPAGGRSDAYARLLQPHLEKALGVPLVIVNRGGGVGVVGATAVQRAAPDGYTLGQWTGALYFHQFITVPPLEWNKSAPITATVRTSMLLSVNKGRPWMTLDELIKFMKANPGKVRLATSGVGATDNIFFHAFLQAVGGGKVTVVPYGGDAPAVAALVRGESDIAFIPLAGVIAFRDDLRFLAVASEKRMGALPEVPTMIDLGVNFKASSQDGVHGPAGLHPLIAKKVEDAYRKVLSDKEVIERLGKLFLEPNFMTSKEWQAFVTEWNPRWEALIAELGLRKK